MPTFRKERMGEAIRKVVSEKFSRDHSPIPNAIITVNRVELAKDFSTAWIFYSVFGSDLEEKELALIMKQHESEFRYEISQKLNLRRTPRIEFRFDKNTEYAFKIDGLLKS
jgi:ribosome-binding factor A